MPKLLEHRGPFQHSAFLGINYSRQGSQFIIFSISLVMYDILSLPDDILGLLLHKNPKTMTLLNKRLRSRIFSTPVLMRRIVFVFKTDNHRPVFYVNILNLYVVDEHISANLPPTLELLLLGNWHCPPLIGIPDTVRRLMCGYLLPDNKLPSGLLELSVLLKSDYSLGDLPRSLKKLTLESDELLSLDGLPEGLKYLAIDGQYNAPVDNLPVNLKTLSLPASFNQPFNNLPPCLDTLILYQYKRPLPTGFKVISYSRFGARSGEMILRNKKFL